MLTSSLRRHKFIFQKWEFAHLLLNLFRSIFSFSFLLNSYIHWTLLLCKSFFDFGTISAKWKNNNKGDWLSMFWIRECLLSLLVVVAADHSEPYKIAISIEMSRYLTWLVLTSGKTWLNLTYFGYTRGYRMKIDSFCLNQNVLYNLGFNLAPRLHTAKHQTAIEAAGAP